jgi:aldehyde:ferredoxin oxidoreductase
MENQHTGYNGKILRVDLSSGMTRTEEIDESFCRRYIDSHYLP